MRSLNTIVIALMSSVCWGHPGGLDSKGGHNDRRNGGYHYHSGAPSPQPDYIAPPIRQSPNVPMPRTSSRTFARTNTREIDAREQIAQDFKPSKTPVASLSHNEKPVVDRERQAQGKLRLGKQLIDKGRPSDAAQWLKDVLQLFPETVAAKEAGPLYQKSTGHKFERDTNQKSEIDREKEAAELLQLSKEFIDKKMPIEATRSLTEILLLLPETSTAKEAGVLFEQLSGHQFNSGKSTR